MVHLTLTMTLRRSVHPLLVVLLLVAVPSAAESRRATVGDGDRLFSAGEFGRAVEVYRDLARGAETPPEVHLRLAAALLKRERPVEALAAADAAVARQASADTYGMRAVARFRAGRFRDAEADRDRALAAPPGETALARLADARLLASEGRYAAALASADASLAGASFLDLAFRFEQHALRADLLDELDRQKEALAAHEAALAVAPATNKLLRENLTAQLAFRRATMGTAFYRVAPATNPDVVTLPLTLKQGIPLVYVSLNGAPPAPFLLDTGAGVSVLFPEYAKKAGFAARDERVWAGAVGGDGRVPLRYGLASKVGLGSMTVENVPFAVIEWNIPNLAGIVGLPLLRPFLVTVDYKAKELRLKRTGAADRAATGPGATGPAATGPGVTPFRLVGGAIFVEATVNGHGPFNFEVDTGATTDAVPVDTTVAAALGLSPTSPGTRRTKGAGAGGTQEAYVHPDAKLMWASLAPANVSLMSQRISPSRPERRDGESGLVAETELEGLIGYAVLGRSALTIDFVAQRLTIRSP